MTKIPTAAVAGGDHDQGPPLISLCDISKNFGPVHALSGVSLDVPGGQVTAAHWRQRRRKTVLIETISGLWAPAAGDHAVAEVLVAGVRPAGSSELARRGQ